MRSPSREQAARRGRQSSWRTESEHGYTLLELIIVVGLIPLVVGAITIATISVLSQRNQVNARVSTSDDALLASTTYVRDVQGAERVTTDSAAVISAFLGCANTLPGTVLVGIEMSDGSTYVAYTEVPFGSGLKAVYELIRYSCVGSTLSVIRVGHELPPSSSNVSVTVTCASTVKNCTSSSNWVAAEGVTSVALAVPTTGTSGSYLYSLDAVPRALSPSSDGTPAGGTPAALMLDNTGSCSAMPPDGKKGAGGWISVTGNPTISTNGGSIAARSSCKGAINVGNGIDISGSQVDSADCSDSPPASINPTTAGPTETCATVDDPLTTISAPTTPLSQTSVSCTPKASVPITCPAGEYATSPTLGSNDTVTFGTSGGIVIFDKAVSVTNNAVVTFAPGTYWFKGGLAISGTSPTNGTSVTVGAGAYLFGVNGTNPTTNMLSVSNGGSISTATGAGSLFYIISGSAIFQGSSANAIEGSPQYLGLAIWDNSPLESSLANDASVTVTAGSQATSGYGGIYIPNGTTTINGAGNVTMSYLVTYAGAFGGSGQVILG